MKKKNENGNIDINVMEKNEIQINGGIMANVDMCVKSVVYVKNIKFEI